MGCEEVCDGILSDNCGKTFVISVIVEELSPDVSFLAGVWFSLIVSIYTEGCNKSTIPINAEQYFMNHRGI